MAHEVTDEVRHGAEAGTPPTGVAPPEVSEAGSAVQRYRRVLAVPAVRTILLLGFFVRMPVFAGGIVLTLHVVTSLDHTYGEAGLVSAAATIAVAVSGPWRGRLLDRQGLRRTVLPCVVVAAACWSVAPFVSYWPLLVLSALAGLFVVPSFSVVRQVLLLSVPEDQRRTAISLDGVFVELSFMIGPALAVWLTTVAPTRWVLFGTQMAGVLAGLVLWVVNPALRSSGPAAGEEGATPTPPFRTWFRPAFLVTCLMAASTTLVLGGTDLGIVAALRDFGSQAQIGLVLAVWGLGSLLGGLVYGGLSRSLPAPLLLGALALTTAPVAFASDTFTLTILLFVTGLLCAPSITATVDAASRLVPEAARGEAMGWHGSFMTSGMAVGAPLAGWSIDRAGYGAGFVVVGCVGVVVAVLGFAALGAQRRRRSRPAV